MSSLGRDRNLSTLDFERAPRNACAGLENPEPTRPRNRVKVEVVVAERTTRPRAPSHSDALSSRSLLAATSPPAAATAAQAFIAQLTSTRKQGTSPWFAASSRDCTRDLRTRSTNEGRDGPFERRCPDRQPQCCPYGQRAPWEISHRAVIASSLHAPTYLGPIHAHETPNPHLHLEPLELPIRLFC